MGYNIDYYGELKFTRELKASELAYLQTVLREDYREHPEWGDIFPDLTYIDLEILKDFSGVRWSGSEGTHNLQDAIELVIALMNSKFTRFGLIGIVEVQGEDHDDQYNICVDGLIVEVQDMIVVGKTIICPHCYEKITLDKST
jgi:hypothetical protein